MTPGSFDTMFFMSLSMAIIAISGGAFGSSLIKALLPIPYEDAAYVRSIAAVVMTASSFFGILGLFMLMLVASLINESITALWLLLTVLAAALVFTGAAMVAAKSTRKKLVQKISDHYIQQHADHMRQHATA